VADGAYFRVHHFARQLASPFRSLVRCSGPGSSRIVDRLWPSWICVTRTALHGRGRERGRPDRRRRHQLDQPGLARAGDRWLGAILGYQRPKARTTPNGTASREVFSTCARQGFGPADPSGPCSQSPRKLRLEPHSGGPGGAQSGWAPARTRGAVWPEAWHEPAKARALRRRDGRTVSTCSRPPDPGLPAAWKEASHPREPRVAVSKQQSSLSGTDATRAISGAGVSETDQVRLPLD